VGRLTHGILTMSFAILFQNGRLAAYKYCGCQLLGRTQIYHRGQEECMPRYLPLFLIAFLLASPAFGANLHVDAVGNRT
jgi:hypothetical protein